MIAILAFYIAVAALLFVTQRQRWCDWWEEDFPLIARDGDYAPLFFLFICAVWPVGFPLTIFIRHEPKPGSPSPLARLVAGERLDREGR